MTQRFDLGVNKAGIRLEMERIARTGNLSQDWLFHTSQNIDAILDSNKAKATHNDGYTADRTMRRVATLPAAFIQHCREVEGWNPYDPEHADRLVKVLNDSDFQAFRTAPGRMALDNGKIR